MTSQIASSTPCDCLTDGTYAVGRQEDFSNVMTNLSALEIESLRLARLQEINNNSKACFDDITCDLNERVGKLERIVDKIINKLVALNYEQLDLSIDEQYGDWA